MTCTLSTPRLTSIVAMGLDGAIGVDNQLPWKLKSDLRFFRKTTLGKTIVMGRKTFDSVGGCLPKRKNIILSHRASLFSDIEGCYQASSVEETLCRAAKLKAREVFVIGGSQTYREFAPFVSRYLITVVKSNFPGADAFLDGEIRNSIASWPSKSITVEKILDVDADEYDFDVIEYLHPNADDIVNSCKRKIASFTSRNHLAQRRVARSPATMAI